MAKTPTADEAPKTIKVRATQTGEYLLVRRREGDVFNLVPRDVTVYDSTGGRPVYDEDGNPVKRHQTAQAQFSPFWMEKVREDMQERTTGAQRALDRETAGIAAGKRPASQVE